MTLTRKMLKAMGIEEDKADQIIEAHMETVDQLKAERDALKADAAKVEELEGTISDLQGQLQAAGDDGWKAKYEEEHKALDELKASVAKDAENAKKRELYKTLLKECGIEDARYVESIMNVTDVDTIDLDGDSIKDADGIRKDVEDRFGAFVARKGTDPAKVATPPVSTGGVAGANPEVVKRLQERHDRLYGRTENREAE